MYYLHRSSFSEMTHLSAGNIGDLLRAILRFVVISLRDYLGNYDRVELDFFLNSHLQIWFHIFTFQW